MTDYLYWVVDCKTPGCENHILLYFLGPSSPSVTHVLEVPDTIEVKCLSCRQTHAYRREEIHTKVGVLPPADFVPHPLIHPMHGE
jgi:hypothetical protein